eukprot:7266115-Pyramimonas_sp.AAC.1
MAATTPTHRKVHASEDARIERCTGVLAHTNGTALAEYLEAVAGTCPARALPRQRIGRVLLAHG